MFKNILLLVLVLFVALAAYMFGTKNTFFRNNENKNPGVSPIAVNNFRDCQKAGNPIMESYPRKCSSNGQTFTENIGNVLLKSDLVNVETPRPGDIVASPLSVKGSARGSWFFEASFPIYLYDESGNEISVAVAQAEGEWMTTDFVPFKATLEFQIAQSEKGELVLKKDNPSGLPENDDEVRFPVYFK